MNVNCMNSYYGNKLEVFKVVYKCSISSLSLFVESGTGLVYSVSHGGCSTTEYTNLRHLEIHEIPKMIIP